MTPFMLPTHEDCNSGFAIADERVGQFLAPARGEAIVEENNRLTYKEFARREILGARDDSEALVNVDAYGFTKRWIRAAFAALYIVPLHVNTRFAIELPFHVVSMNDDEALFSDGGRPRQRVWCQETLERNRSTKTTDVLVAWNGNFRFECVWVRTPLRAYCIFQLDYYSWNTKPCTNNPIVGPCVGFAEVPLPDLPYGISETTTLEFGNQTFKVAL